MKSYYVPLFEKIVDSSLWEEPDFVVKVFISMLVKKDRDDVVRASAFNISRWARKTEAETLEALKILSSPDTRRLEPQPFEGRRIEKVEDGWLILNGSFYQEQMTKANRREYLRLKQQEHRDKKKAEKAAFQRDPITAAPPGQAEAALRRILSVEQSSQNHPPSDVNPPSIPDLRIPISDM